MRDDAPATPQALSGASLAFTTASIQVVSKAINGAMLASEVNALPAWDLTYAGSVEIRYNPSASSVFPVTLTVSFFQDLAQANTPGATAYYNEVFNFVGAGTLGVCVAHAVIPAMGGAMKLTQSPTLGGSDAILLDITLQSRKVEHTRWLHNGNGITAMGEVLARNDQFFAPGFSGILRANFLHRGRVGVYSSSGTQHYVIIGWPNLGDPGFALLGLGETIRYWSEGPFLGGFFVHAEFVSPSDQICYAVYNTAATPQEFQTTLIAMDDA